MTYPIADEVLDLRMQCALDTAKIAQLSRDLQATRQALLDEQAAHRNDAVIAGPARAYCAAHDGDPWDLPREVEAQDALFAAHRATTPSQTTATHVVVAVDELERLQAGMSREHIEAVLSDYYGALTQTAIDNITDALSSGAS